MGGFWILGGSDGHTPVHVEDVLVWGRWFEDFTNRRVAWTDIPNGHGFVSTVFVGLDQRFGHAGPPILFETTSHLGGEWEDYTDRYCTWSEAEAGHVAIVTRIIEALEHASAGMADALVPADTIAGGQAGD